jgi:hypothetical protein
VFFQPDLGTVTRHAAAELFRRLFMPGQIVVIAFASDSLAGPAAAGEP